MRFNLLLLLLILAAPSPAVADRGLADRLLKVILAGDAEDLRIVMNRESEPSAEAIDWLIGGPSVRPGGKPDLVSARQVLTGQKVLTKVVSTEQADGSLIIEVIYLPTRTAPGFGELAALADSEAANFRDYMMCEFIVKDGRTFMRNICFADTDVFSGPIDSLAETTRADAQRATAPAPLSLNIPVVLFKEGSPASGQRLRDSLAEPISTQIVRLELIRDYLLANEMIKVGSKAFTDGLECDPGDCKSLSLKRAAAVHAWMIDQGVSESSLSAAEGLGADFPIADDATEFGRQTNRRLEFELIFPAEWGG